MKTMKLTLALCLFSVFAFANITTQEKDALVAIYNATQGDNWTQSWDLNADVTAWQGLTIKDNKVVAIDLSFNNLVGTLPEELGNLTNLESLNLFRNRITGAIPSTIWNLKQLKVLNIAFNKLDGKLPDTIGNIENLVTLELFMNKI